MWSGMTQVARALSAALAVVAAGGWIEAARAGEAGEPPAAADAEEGPARIGPVVVTATRVEQPASEVGSAVTIISGDDLRRRGIEFVADALDEVPGVTVPRSGTRGKTASIFVRGSNANQTLVLIDGIRVNDPVSGGFDFGALTTDNVERIEVIRGPQSPLYGSEAMGGVVNIITRRGRGPITGTVGAAGGNYDTSRVEASVQGASEGLSASVEASRFATDNRFENDDFEVKTASGRLDARLTDRLSATATFRWSDSETGAPGQIFIAADRDDRQENSLVVGGVSLEHRTASLWTQRLSLSRADQELRFSESPSAAPDVTKSVSESVEWVHTLRPAPWLGLVVGGEYRADDGQGFTIDRHLVTRAVYAQAQLLLWGDRLTLQGGGRLDDGTQLDHELTPKVAASLAVPGTGTRLHASWGKGIKAPTLVDLFFPGFGNPNLGPERVTGWDAGVEQRLGSDRLTADVTFFRNDFTDLIVFSPVTFLPENVGQAHGYGVESTLTLRPAAWAELGAVYTYTEAVNDVTHEQLLRRPRNQGNARVTLRPHERASATLAVLYVGDRRDSTFAPGSTPRTFPGYARVDASALYRLGPLGRARRLELVARVENLLDRSYEEVAGFPALGINFLAGLRGTF